MSIKKKFQKVELSQVLVIVSNTRKVDLSIMFFFRFTIMQLKVKKIYTANNEATNNTRCSKKKQKCYMYNTSSSQNDYFLSIRRQNSF